VGDYGVISDVSTSLVTLLNQDLRTPPLNARAQLDDLPQGGDHADEIPASLTHFANSGPVTRGGGGRRGHLR
jgi:hypothetical protein